MTERALKTGWHLLIAGVTLIEYQTASSTFRRMVLGACIGWHLAAAQCDWNTEAAFANGLTGVAKCSTSIPAQPSQRQTESQSQ